MTRTTAPHTTVYLTIAHSSDLTETLSVLTVISAMVGNVRVIEHRRLGEGIAPYEVKMEVSGTVHHDHPAFEQPEVITVAVEHGETLVRRAARRARV